MSKADIFERIAASVPQSAAAARVVSKGVHYEPNINWGSYDHRDTPPPMMPIPAETLRTCSDLPGRKFGRFTVLGLAAEQGSKNHKARWVVRCTCGAYEFRKAKAIRNPENSNDKCKACRHLDDIKRAYAKHGSRPVMDFVPEPEIAVLETPPSAPARKTTVVIPRKRQA